MSDQGTTLTEAQLSAVEAELAQDGVWVADQLRDQVSPAQEQQIEDAVASSSAPAYVTLARLDHDDPLTSGSPADLARIIHLDTGRDGHYLGVPSYGDLRVEVTSFPDQSADWYASALAEEEHPGDLTAQVLTTLDLLGDPAAAREQYNQTHPEPGGPPDPTDPIGTGTGGAPTPWLLGGGLLVLTVVAAVVFDRRRRRRRTPVASAVEGRSLVLPVTVLGTVRAAEDRRREDEALAAVLGLGEAIDAAELRANRDEVRRAWQAALDHYDVASRILHRDHTPADAVGALVLARRGHEAMAAALARKGWTPARPCYFNALHPAAARRVSWSESGSKSGSEAGSGSESGRAEVSVEVPACPACADAVRAGREPADILDFLAHGVPRHYFTLDLGAWSESGYGALDTDLLARLLAFRGHD
ncbi:LPXTG cell wall anchor domain-containing protein [Nocardioides insulae]|uniref:LPXTG cell wall anchor domain-containing protein n=1 Tax=Nocardioides insulae TaxID=394734 RepID=UPI0003FC4DB8|nr:LPXTG cell wall anchor domain-containing protein [Nocardioides insulae]